MEMETSQRQRGVVGTSGDARAAEKLRGLKKEPLVRSVVN
jgi:hypothetical protein